MGIFDKLKRQPAKDEAKKLQAEKPADDKATKPADAKTDKPAAKKPAAKKADKKPAAKKEKKPSKGSLAKDTGGRSALILMAPVLTEKAGKQEAEGKYSFLVADTANKVEVAEAVRDLYGVKPTAVRIVNVKGKKVRFGRKQGQRKTRKKAIVSLKSGDAISLTE
jgi:large subunit ribosomal protein L23